MDNDHAQHPYYQANNAFGRIRCSGRRYTFPLGPADVVGVHRASTAGYYTFRSWWGIIPSSVGFAALGSIILGDSTAGSGSNHSMLRISHRLQLIDRPSVRSKSYRPMLLFRDS
jgi:hypothetical protein